MNLNSQQRAAALRIDGATLLLAVPGSGKTTVIICRLGYMIKVLKIPPESILTMTFSRAGAADLGRRYRSLIGSDGKAPHFSTIHSFAYSVIRIYSKMTGRPVFDVMEDTTPILKTLYLKLFKTYPGDTELDEVKNAIGLVKNTMMSKDEMAQFDFGDLDLPKIYTAYEQYKKENRVMDYDDMLVYAYGLLKREQALFDFFAGRYRYICLDEAQDTSRLQFAIIELLAKQHGNIFMVGDEDQSIYGFRGADPETLLNFKNIYPGGEVLLMETNYRTTAKLVAAADRFIQKNPDRYEKHMITPNPAGVAAVREITPDQYQFILNCVKKEGKETAILYRNNESVIPLVDLFEKNNIPYTLKEHKPVFFSHFLLRDLRGFYALAADPTNLDHFKAVCHKMNCFVKKEQIDAIDGRLKKKQTVFDALASLHQVPQWQKDRFLDTEDVLKTLNRIPVSRGLTLIMDDLGYREHLEYRIDHGYPRERIDQKIAILKTMADRYRNKDDFWQRLAALEIMLKDKDCREDDPRDRRRPVTLSTIHSAKGLEWEKVMMIDCVEGEFPSRSALADTDRAKQLLTEEIRLFYVGITRAKKELEFIITGKNNRPDVRLPESRFVRQYLEPK